MSHIPNMKIRPLIDGVRQGSTSLLSLGALLFSSLAFYEVYTSNTVIFTTLRVPPSFEQKGFTPEITTQRLIDEIARLNNFSLSSRDRIAYGDASVFENIAKADMSIAGIDFRQIAATVQKAMGREPKRISGEIAIAETRENSPYSIRLRMTPPRRLLVDINAMGEPQEIIHQTAMALLEELDPAIAANIHRLKGDNERAEKLNDATLTNADPNDDSAAYTNRSLMLASSGKYEAAYDAAMSAGENTRARHIALAHLYRESDQLEKSVTESDILIHRWPNFPHGYFFKGRALLRMDKRDEAIKLLQESISIAPDYWLSHYWLGQAHSQKENFEAARLSYSRSVALAPDVPANLLALGDIERRRGNHVAAVNAYRKLYALNQGNFLYLLNLIETEAQLGNQRAVDELAQKLRDGIVAGRIPERLKKRAENFVTGNAQ